MVAHKIIAALAFAALVVTTAPATHAQTRHGGGAPVGRAVPAPRPAHPGGPGRAPGPSRPIYRGSGYGYGRYYYPYYPYNHYPYYPYYGGLGFSFGFGVGYGGFGVGYGYPFYAYGYPYYPYGYPYYAVRLPLLLAVSLRRVRLGRADLRGHPYRSAAEGRTCICGPVLCRAGQRFRRFDRATVSDPRPALHRGPSGRIRAADFRRQHRARPNDHVSS